MEVNRHTLTEGKEREGERDKDRQTDIQTDIQTQKCRWWYQYHYLWVCVLN